MVKITSCSYYISLQVIGNSTDIGGGGLFEEYLAKIDLGKGHTWRGNIHKEGTYMGNKEEI